MLDIISYLMEGDQLVFIIGITCATIAAGVFIYFGPRPGNRKKVPILGLQNLGQTCFVNTILQAFGSCPIFIDWLDTQPLGEIGEELRSVLIKLSQILPNDAVDTVLQPLELLQCLVRHGWRRNFYDNSHQDAHELMVFILSKIEDEILLNTKNKQNGLDIIDKEKLPNGINSPPTGEDSPRLINRNHVKKLLTSNINVQSNYASPFRGRLVNQIRCTACGHENALKYDNFDSLSLHLPPSASLTHTLSQLLEYFVKTEIIQDFECEKCNKNNQLPPPPAVIATTPSDEEDEEDEDDENTCSSSATTSTSSSKKILTDAIKTVRIGKLPQCLCFHIHRTSYSIQGGAYKRQDYIHFPEYLNMELYTYNAILREKEVKKKLVEQNDGVLPNDHTNFSNLEYRNSKGSNNIYRLKSVVVHRGSAEHGHFITYRRGPLKSHSRYRCSSSSNNHNSHSQNINYDSRWYLTSDGDVSETTLSHALQSVAYMIFYEKCSSLPNNDMEVNGEVNINNNVPPANGHILT